LSQENSFEELKKLFAADLTEKVKLLQVAVRETNWETIARISHQIKGTAKSFGFTEVSVLADELEQSAAQKMFEKTVEIIREISDRSVL